MDSRNVQPEGSDIGARAPLPVTGCMPVCNVAAALLARLFCRRNVQKQTWARSFSQPHPPVMLYLDCLLTWGHVCELDKAVSAACPMSLELGVVDLE